MVCNTVYVSLFTIYFQSCMMKQKLLKKNLCMHDDDWAWSLIFCIYYGFFFEFSAPHQKEFTNNRVLICSLFDKIGVYKSTTEVPSNSYYTTEKVKIISAKRKSIELKTTFEDASS